MNFAWDSLELYKRPAVIDVCVEETEGSICYHDMYSYIILFCGILHDA